jgi:hypothetical protein
MASLPDVPQNTIVAIGVLAGAGLVALVNHNKTKIDSQIHENYRHAKVVDANVQTGNASTTSIAELPSHRSA